MNFSKPNPKTVLSSVTDWYYQRRSIAQYASFQQIPFDFPFLKQNSNKQKQIESLTSIATVHHNKLKSRLCVPEIKQRHKHEINLESKHLDRWSNESRDIKNTKRRKSKRTSWQRREILQRPCDSAKQSERWEWNEKVKMKEKKFERANEPIGWGRCWTRRRWHVLRWWEFLQRRGRFVGEQWDWEAWCCAGLDLASASHSETFSVVVSVPNPRN